MTTEKTNRSLKRQIKLAFHMPESAFSNHETDLYVKLMPEKPVLEQWIKDRVEFPKNISKFYRNVDGCNWLDIPFSFVKAGRTYTKESNDLIRKYILDCVDGSNYNIDLPTDAIKLKFVVEKFKNQAGKESINYHKTYQEAFINWLQGLPSVLNVDFENYAIEELLWSWGLLGDNMSDNKIDEMVRVTYWRILFREFSALLTENNILLQF